MSAVLPADVRFVQASGLELDDRAPAAHFGTVFMSNYLEHLESSDAVIEQLAVVRQLLAPGGRAIVLQPNIRLVGPRYWDFIDHAWRSPSGACWRRRSSPACGRTRW